MTTVEQKGRQIRFIMYERAKIDPQRIPGLLKTYGNDLVFRAEEPPCFFYEKKGKSGKENGTDILETIRKILEDIKSLCF